jgi:ribosomal protein S18 acetylase RimI-like enzyme
MIFDFSSEKQNLIYYEKSKYLSIIYVISQECDEEYHEWKWENPDESAYIIHRLCVSPDYQNRGIGSKVLSHIEEQIKSMGYLSIRLDVFSENPYALKLYEKTVMKNVDMRIGDTYGTAVCPYCGIDSAIGDNSGYPIIVEFLKKMHQHWFK